MSKSSIIEKSRHYLKRRVKSILLLLLFLVIFGVVFYLEHLPIKSVFYAFLLCAFCGLIYLIIDFQGFATQHQNLIYLKDKIDVYNDISHIVAHNQIEQDYLDIINSLLNYKAVLSSRIDMKQQDMIDYYSLWAHQIKTPIAAMQLLLEDDADNRNDLKLELFKIEQYVEMVLQYLRLDSSSTDYAFKEHDLDDIIRQAIRKYAKMFINKKITLDYTGVDCKVLSDEKWLVFVVEQLLSNALKYTNQGSIKIYLDQSQKKTLIIEDTGMGINPEDLPRIFEKGFTGCNGRIDKKSTGIGLYLVYSVLTKLGHGVSVKSQVDKGTRFYVDLDIKHLETE